MSRKLSLPEKRILILCEGESEVKYFLSYRTAEENRERLKGVEVEVYKPRNHSPVGLVKEAKKQFKESKRDGMPYTSVWVVFDKDGHANIPNAFEEARTATPAINIAFSAICFEYWILLHFHQRKICFPNGDAIVDYVKQHCVNGYCKVKLGYNDLKGSLEVAMKNANWLRKQNQNDINNGKRIYELDAFTNIDELMKVLITLNVS